MVVLRKIERWKYSLITGIVGFVIFEIALYCVKYSGNMFGTSVSNALNTALEPLQIGSFLILALNLAISMHDMPNFHKDNRQVERVYKILPITILFVQVLAILTMLLFSFSPFLTLLSIPSDSADLVEACSRWGFVFLLTATVFTIPVSFLMQKPSRIALVLTIAGIVILAFITIASSVNLLRRNATIAYIVSIACTVQPFAILLPALQLDIPFFKKNKLEKNESEKKQMNAERSKVIAALLAFFVGGAGVHRYYLGYTKEGTVQTSGFVSLIIGFSLYSAAIYTNDVLMLFALFFLLFGLATVVWSFVDFVRILTGSLLPADGMPYTESVPKQVHIVNGEPTINDSAEALEKLAALHKQGVLTDEEFQKKKADILERM